MFARKRVIQVKRRRHRSRRLCGLSARDGLQFLSHLILPLMLGVFTVIITFQQQKMARDQRVEDMQLARQQRLEDKTESRLQREQDKNESRLQREQDKNESRLQREQDKNESRLQREQELNISQNAQAAQREALINQYRDGILIAYIKEIGDLLEKNNGSLTSYPLTVTLARAKTLNAFRQLDGPRQIHIINFLYEAGQLTNTDKSVALDISTAELTEIDFRKFMPLNQVEKISLAGVYLRNCTFQGMELKNINFLHATLENVSFSSAKELTDVNFSSAWLTNVNFSLAVLSKVNFSSAEQLHNVDFSSAVLNDINFSSVRRLENVDFSSAQLLNNVNFSLARLKYVDFSSARRLVNVDFSSANLSKVNFSFGFLGNGNFSSAKQLPSVNFSSTELVGVNFSSTGLVGVTFSSARFFSVTFLSAMLYDINFSRTDLCYVNFSSAWLFNVTFLSARLYYSADFSLGRFQDVNFLSTEFVQPMRLINFDHVIMAHTIFMKCICDMVVFTGANLKNSSFHGSSLDNSSFSLANLENADFTNTTITDSQLQSALSIRNAKLPNGTLGKSRNLVKNGDANCNISLVSHWKVQNGNIVMMPSKEDRAECQFTLQSITTVAIMSQRITLVRIWDYSFWTNSMVELRAHMSSGVSIELSDLNNYKAIMKLENDMQELEIVVKFNTQNNKSNTDEIWCDNIELFIVYDTQRFK